MVNKISINFNNYAQRLAFSVVIHLNWIVCTSTQIPKWFPLSLFFRYKDMRGLSIDNTEISKTRRSFGRMAQKERIDKYFCFVLHTMRKVGRLLYSLRYASFFNFSTLRIPTHRNRWLLGRIYHWVSLLQPEFYFSLIPFHVPVL